ncbi:MAG: fumarylacetoacetate hydrolase family protein [Acidobacteriota bacterium]|nr:fumarylacetoacetate hydrolase family protein [Acidobacteriota bacterium]
MKLVTYAIGKQSRPGVAVGKNVVDVGAAVEMVRSRRGPKTLYSDSKFKKAAGILADAGAAPREMTAVIGRGDEWLKALGVVTRGIAREEKALQRGAGKSVLLPLDSVRLRAPIARPGMITCVGLNYADHAREQGIEPPDSPIFFLKGSNTISGPGDPIVMPPNSDQVDFEAEFAVVIGKAGRRISEENAQEHIAGYMILHDVTARDFQQKDKQWFRGKSCDTFAPTGPWIVTKDEVPDPNALSISCAVNGVTMQDSNTSNLIFKIPYLISFLSQSITWEPGDLISTGTPPGVGVFRKPSVFLKAGDSVSVTVEKLGTLTNPVVGPE